MSLFGDLMRDSGRPALDAVLNLYPHAITIMQPTSAKDSFGQEIPGAPSVFATAAAKVLDQSGAEVLDDGRVVAQRDFTLEFLYVAGVTSAMVVVMGGRTFEIRNVWSPGDRNVYTRLLVRERL